MARANILLCFMGLVFLGVCSSFVEGNTWCVAQVGAPDSTLQRVLDDLCGSQAADCIEIQPGRSCFMPNTVRNHASYAIDSNFRRHGVCDTSYATPSPTDPSWGTCVYP